MAHKNTLDIPTTFEADRIYLRSYQPGDGSLLFEISQKNKDHLAKYESENALLSIKTVQDAEALARDLSAEWQARNHFFFGAFDRHTDDFVAQIYLGPANWELHEFVIGYIADVNHEGQGFVTEAVKAVLSAIFHDLKANKVRLYCADTNQRSWHVAERCGFHRQRHIPKNKPLPDGSIVGTYIYSLSRQEYLTQNKSSPQ